MNTSHLSLKLLCLTLSTILLSACGGGGSGSNSTNSKTNHVPDKKQTSPNTDPKEEVPADTDPKETLPSAADKKKAALAAYNALNLRRQACGFGKLALNKELEKAATNHANYMLYMIKHSKHSFQGHGEYKVDPYSGDSNPYYSGYTPRDRLQTNSIGKKALPVNYESSSSGEDLSSSYFPHDYLQKLQKDDSDIALNDLNRLLAAPYHLASMVNPQFTEVGMVYGRQTRKLPLEFVYGDGTRHTVPAFQSILEVVLGRPSMSSAITQASILNYPCSEMNDTTDYELTNEIPNPFGENGRDLEKNPIGQPIYIWGNGAIKVTNYHITNAANEQQSLKVLTSKNDPHKILRSHQVILMPLKALQPNQMYRVTYDVSVNGGTPISREVRFKTKPAD